MIAKSEKVERRFNFEPEVIEQLDALTAEPGTTKSEIVNNALISYLKQRGADQFEVRFTPRLDRMDDRLNRIERDLLIVLESLALFIRYELAITPPLPASQLAASQAAGNERFQTFIDQVSRRVAQGKVFGNDVVERAQRERDIAAGEAAKAPS